MSMGMKNNSIAEIISARRKELGLPVKQVANEVGVSESTIRDWENGRKISGEPYFKIAKALNIPVMKLLSEQELKISEIELELTALKKCVKNIEEMIIPFI